MSLFSQLKDAWQQRHQLGSSNHTRELAAFLPAVLEIQEAPQNPIAKWLGRSLLILFTLIVIWACVGKVNIVASAEGKIIPSARVKAIQPLEKAVVSNILVGEGEYVTQGQALIELDSTLTGADEQRIRNERNSTQWQHAVSQALLALLNTPVAEHNTLSDKDMTLAPVSGASEQDQQLHTQLLWQQWQTYASQYAALNNSLKRNQAEQAATQAEINKFKQTLPIITQRVQKIQRLLDKNYASETQFMELEQARIEATQDLLAEQQRLQQLLAGEQEITQQILTHIAQTRAQTITTIADTQRQIATLNEELAKAQDRHAKQRLYAPVSGQVQQLAINTIGGVVTEAQQLMIIVPDTEQLEVEVFLANKDIGFVHENMSAEIKIHTFPFTKYGIIDATVTNVSNDATLDERQGLIYAMHLLMDKNTIQVENKNVKLIPGMAVTAEIQTGHRRIIEFFLAPLLRHGKEGLRER